MFGETHPEYALALPSLFGFFKPRAFAEAARRFPRYAPAGYVLIYYFLPASVRNPIYSHKLSLVGFWSLAVFYPFVGIHHYLFSPIADWAETIAIVSSSCPCDARASSPGSSSWASPCSTWMR